MKKRGKLISNRAQAAMEFLMNYGWAIMVVLTTIAALAYFGILNPSRFMPRSCALGPEITCSDFEIYVDQLNTVLIAKLHIQNNLPDPIRITAINFSVVNYQNTDCLTSQVIQPDGILDFYAKFPSLQYKREMKFNSEITITYDKLGGFSGLTKKGFISTTLSFNCYGDFNGNGQVGSSDLAYFSSSYGSEVGDERYDPMTDFNCDGKVNSLDIGPFSSRYLTC